MKTAKELRENAKAKATMMSMAGWLFDWKMLKEYSEQLCKEQRDSCADTYDIWKSERKKDIEALIRYAPEPEI